MTNMRKTIVSTRSVRRITPRFTFLSFSRVSSLPKIKRVIAKRIDNIGRKIKTCSCTPIFKWFLYKDMDHMLVRGLKKKDVGFLEGRSDHKLVYADLD